MYNGHSYEWYRKHMGLKCSLMMDRSNIVWAISRGGEHKAMSSLVHLSPYLPSHFTPSHKQQDGDTVTPTHKDTQTHTSRTRTRTHAHVERHTGIEAYARRGLLL